MTKFALLGAALLGVAAPAFAQEPTILTSEQEFTRVEANGRAALDAGRIGDALLIAQDALTFARREFGPASQLAFRAMNDLAVVRLVKGESAAALPMALEAAGGLERLAGPDHPDTVNAMANLAQLYIALRRPVEAEPLLRRVYTTRVRTLGAAREGTLTALLEWAVFMSREHRLREIAGELQQGAATARTALGADNDTARDLSEAAEAARGAGSSRTGAGAPAEGPRGQERVRAGR